eukprot:s3597_g6.t1
MCIDVNSKGCKMPKGLSPSAPARLLYVPSSTADSQSSGRGRQLLWSSLGPPMDNRWRPSTLCTPTSVYPGPTAPQALFNQDQQEQLRLMQGRAPPFMDMVGLRKQAVTVRRQVASAQLRVSLWECAFLHLFA